MSGVNSLDPRIQPIWVTSQNELAHYLVEVGRERGLDEAAARLRIPPIMRLLWRHAELWRLAFKGQSWLDRRRGDGHLLGAPDGGFGALGDHIDHANWTVSLEWVRRRYRDGRIDEPYEFAHCYLGLRLNGQDDLRKLPRSALLELKFIAIEAALIDVLTQEQQSQPPSPQMNLHLHTTVPSESEKQTAPESSDQTSSLDAILPGTGGRPSVKDALLLEMYRRATRGKGADGVAEEARQLLQWLIGRHPKVTPPTAESIENVIRQEFKPLKPKSTK